jgi:protein-S-isoprenylcysteine O-methyltransferase Ste14
MQTADCPVVAKDRRSDWTGFACFSLWTLINAALAVGVLRRAPVVAVFLVPTFTHEALIAVSFLVRKPLLNQVKGWMPQAAAYGATFLVPAFCFACSQWHPGWMKPSSPPLFVAGITLWIVGAYLGIWSLFRLRAAFSIVPQARTLVTGGPYRVARHPVYASYLLQYGGVALSHLTAASLVVFFAWFGAAMARICYEETVLAAAFPAYEDYRQQVGRFTPRWAWRRQQGTSASGPLQPPPAESRLEA